jgi:hypothetical protein
MSVRKSYYRDSQELAEIVPVVVYLLVNELVVTVFPNSRPSRPSELVELSPRKVIPGEFRPLFPIRVDGEQWNNVVVPVLRDIQTYGWSGKIIPLAEFLSLLQDVYGPGGATLYSKGEVWASGSPTQKQPGVTYEKAPYLEEISLKVQSLAISFGY